jgi:hypothetical protein
MLATRHQSTATLGRVALRLTIVLILSLLWPGDSPARAAGFLSLLFAAAVLWTAYAKGERPTGPGLNRLHEGALLAVLGLILFLWFGLDLASNQRSSVGSFVGSECSRRDIPGRRQCTTSRDLAIKAHGHVPGSKTIDLSQSAGRRPRYRCFKTIASRGAKSRFRVKTPHGI